MDNPEILNVVDIRTYAWIAAGIGAISAAIIAGFFALLNAYFLGQREFKRLEMTINNERELNEIKVKREALGELSKIIDQIAFAKQIAYFEEHTVSRIDADEGRRIYHEVLLFKGQINAIINLYFPEWEKDISKFLLEALTAYHLISDIAKEKDEKKHNDGFEKILMKIKEVQKEYKELVKKIQKEGKNLSELVNKSIKNQV